MGSSHHLMAYLPEYSEDQITRMISGVGSRYLDQMSTSQREEVFGIITHAMDKAYILVITCGATSLILSSILVGLNLANRKKNKTAESDST